MDLADTRIARPTGTLPQKLRNPVELKACDRLVNHPAVTLAAVLAPAAARTQERTAGVVIGREIDPPPGVVPVEWVLVTNVPIETAAEAWDRVGWYECRWEAEEDHEVLKTGCGIEGLPCTTEPALQRRSGGSL